MSLPLYTLYLFPLGATALVAWVALTFMGRPPGELAANANYLATCLRQQMELSGREKPPARSDESKKLADTIRSEADAVRSEFRREHRERRFSTIVAGVGLGCCALLVAALTLFTSGGLPADWLWLMAAICVTVFVPAILRLTLWNMLPELIVSTEILDLLETWLRDTPPGVQLFQEAANRYSDWRVQRGTLLGRTKMRLLGTTSAEQR